MKRLITVCLVAALAFPTSLLAQESEERGQLVNVQTWRIAPGDAAPQDAEIQKIVQAAKDAGLSGPGASWYFWSNDFTYTLAFPVENFAYFDTPGQFMKMFEGKPGEDTMKEAFAALEKIPGYDVKNELAMVMPGWSYEPEAALPIRGAEVNEYWVKAGQQEAFGALAKEALTLFKEVGYPYRVDGHRVLFGDIGRIVFVTFYDDAAQYHGEHSLEVHLKKAGREDDWKRMGERFVQLVDQVKSSHMTYRPELSYEASMPGQAAQGGSE